MTELEEHELKKCPVCCVFLTRHDTYAQFLYFTKDFPKVFRWHRECTGSKLRHNFPIPFKDLGF